MVEAAQPFKTRILKLMEACNRTCGLLVILQAKSSEKLMSNNKRDNGKLIVFLPAAKKKRSSASI
jgi:hypothetical protein